MTKLNELSIAVGEAAFALAIATKAHDAAWAAFDAFVHESTQEPSNTHSVPADEASTTISEPEGWDIESGIPHEADHHTNGGDTVDQAIPVCESPLSGDGDEANGCATDTWPRQCIEPGWAAHYTRGEVVPTDGGE